MLRYFPFSSACVLSSLGCPSSIYFSEQQRYRVDVGRYSMHVHAPDDGNLPTDNGNRTAMLLRTAKRRWYRDGLSSLHYKLVGTQMHAMYTELRTDLIVVDESA